MYVKMKQSDSMENLLRKNFEESIEIDMSSFSLISEQISTVNTFPFDFLFKIAPTACCVSSKAPGAIRQEFSSVLHVPITVAVSPCLHS